MSQVGIEPTTRGLKVPCSTTELLARIGWDFTSKQRANQRAQPTIAGGFAVPLDALRTGMIAARVGPVATPSLVGYVRGVHKVSQKNYPCVGGHSAGFNVYLVLEQA